MNFVGKVLIVLNLALCLLFMAFAAAVFTAQKNWNAKIAEGGAAIAQLEKEKGEDRQAFDDFKNTMTAQVTELKGRADQLSASNTELTQSLNTTRQERDEAREARNAAQTEVKIASEESRSRISESEQLRKETSKLRVKIDSQLQEKRKLLDQVIALERQLTSYEAKNIVTVQRVADLTRLLRVNGLDPDEIVDVAVQNPPPRVNGKVLTSRKNASRDTEYVEVSIGSDDGLEKNHVLYVYRGEKFLADIVLTDVRPDKAVGVVIKRAKNGVIGRDDNVASKL